MLAFQIVLARLLAPTAFGLFALGWTSFRLAEALGPLGLQAGVLRFASATAVLDPSSARPTVFRATRLAFVSGAILGAAMFIFAPLAATQLFHKAGAIGALRWFALGVPCLTVLIVAAGATQALQTTRYVATIRELGQPLLVAFFATAAVLAGLGVSGAALGAASATALTAVAALVMIHRLFPPGERNIAGVSNRALLAVSIPAAAASTFRLLLSWTDRLVVGAYLPAASLGAYHAAAQLASVLSMIVVSFSGILAAMIVAALADGDTARARSLYRTSIKWMLYLATPILVPLIVAPRDALIATFGSAYVDAAPALRLLAIGQGLSLLTGAVGSLLVMTGHERRWTLLAATSFTTNLGLSLWLTPRWGLLGAAVSTAIALGVLTVLGIAAASNALNGPSLNWEALKALAIIGVASAGGFVILPHLPAQPGVRSLALVALAIGVLGIGIAVVGLDPEERSLYRAVRKWLGVQSMKSRTK
jgi:O-antigen/teichoic acid export membrane protein